MRIKKNNVFLLYLVVSLVIYGVSIFFNTVFNFNKNDYFVSINSTFPFFALSSLVMLILHVIIYQKNKDQLGYAFLITLTIKLTISYFYISKIQNDANKIAALIYFYIFLTTDVIMASLLLNKKE
ncbi:hypothetical protein [Flavobacterium sp.]|uniref:hypothetical protein n=1 Tax=Flavobacterium sp. TaxID=239 RepID=UPI0035282F9A